MENFSTKEYWRASLKDENYEKLLEQLDYLYITGCYEKVVSSCNIILTQNKNSSNEPQFRAQLLHSLVKLNRIPEAEKIIGEWLLSIDDYGESKLAIEKTLKTFSTLKTEEDYDSWMKTLRTILKSVTKDGKHFDKVTHSLSQVCCIYCNTVFKNNSELMAHCATTEHEATVMSDDGHDWSWRAPPRGGNPGTYALCSNWEETMSCQYGIQCVEAHGEAELTEWKERFRYRELRMSKAKEKNLFGKSYREIFLEKWSQSKDAIMSEHLSDVEVFCSSPLKTTVSFKTQSHEFKFCLKATKALRAAALLKDESANHFYFSKIVYGGEESLIENVQEFVNSQNSSFHFEYKIKISFKTEIFGTFRQSVVFDFGTEPVLVKHLCVDVVPDSEMEKIEEIRKEVSFFGSERWTKSNSEIVPFTSPLGCYETEWERKLKNLYPEPDENFILSSETVRCKKLTKFKYKEQLHELLMVEEMARLKLLSSHNLETELQLAPSYTLSPDSTAASTTKYALKEELFAFFPLCTELSEDTPEGRLILRHCNSVLLKPKPDEEEMERVYQAIIEDKTKDAIYLRLSAQTVSELNLNTKMRFKVQIQFELNRTPYCEWHFAVDGIRDYGILFPETYIEPIIPWSPSRQWSSSLDSRLNLKQKEAVMAITTPLSVKIPPILIIGPFGTGKTFTLAQAVQKLIKDDKNKILLCTHSNSAADLYIKDYLDVAAENGEKNARPLRIYYQKRWVATVAPVVQKYCLIRTKAGNVREFYPPTLEDIERHKIIVVTLATSVYLSEIGVLPGTFTHILLDEAAQALECETITPLGLATNDTRIVLAGDHMQLGPDIFSDFNKQKNLHISLLERLYYHYPATFPCKILLRENYRAHEAIIQFTSESFYDQKLVASSKQPRHPVYHPLTFFTARGEDVQCKNSTAFHNDAEVYEIVARVAQITQSWPKEWGKINENSIGVVTPYPDQVFRIRAELRKRRINVCVERVLNVQGKQFRVVVLSTVRTRGTCKGTVDEDYGFLTNSKLLNTAITRAQSLVAVVGDPIAVCSLGKCCKIFEKFIKICNENNSLFGVTWSQLRYHLDSIELKKIYTLNPLAPEFIPRKYRPRVNNGYPYNFNYMYSPVPTVCPPMYYGYRPIPMRPQPPFSQAAPSVAPPAQNNNVLEAQIVNDCVNLLPPNISLAEMMTKPPSVHEAWYEFLRERYGLEAANKFKFLLLIINQKGNSFSHGYTGQVQKSNPLYKRQGTAPAPAQAPGDAESGSREESRSTENHSFTKSLMSHF